MKRRIRDIEFRHLLCFIRAVEQGSFRKASITMGVRQSSISRCIRDLEDRLGTSLFPRHRNVATLGSGPIDLVGRS
ncbi:helix-turn-helix domain-containing protein [Salipiger thiooxidans]|uniref:helix-turn-helix domain-containing protein n=1 Tax=Salipiger thiooxidans TaxID=282683 RepID=UPI001CD26985|nr:LysR family transcriptional regulator [Salipiger thiooxidans]